MPVWVFYHAITCIAVVSVYAVALYNAKEIDFGRALESLSLLQERTLGSSANDNMAKTKKQTLQSLQIIVLIYVHTWVAAFATVVVINSIGEMMT